MKKKNNQVIICRISEKSWKTEEVSGLFAVASGCFATTLNQFAQQHY